MPPVLLLLPTPLRETDILPNKMCTCGLCMVVYIVNVLAVLSTVVVTHMTHHMEYTSEHRR